MNAASEMFEVARFSGIVVITPTRDLRELEFEAIQEELGHLADDPTLSRVVVDLGRTDYLGSTALGMFVALARTLRQRGGRLVLCNSSAHEREIVGVTGLADVLPSYPSLQDALRAVA
jgi:anti-anti-sigma factor